MKKYLPIPILTAVLGGVSFILRRWQLATAFEPETGLLIPGAPATYLLVAVTILGAAAYLLLCRGCGKESYPDSYAHCFHAPNPVPLAMCVLAGGLLVAAGILGIWEVARGATEQWSRAVLGAGTILTGIALEEIGRRNFAGKPEKGRLALVLLVPGYCACGWLVVAYQGHTVNPNVMEYMFLMLGIVAAILGCYFLAAFSFEGPKPRLAVWSCAMAVQLLCTSLADGGDAMNSCIAGAFALYLFTQMTVLLYRGSVPSDLPALELPPLEDGKKAENEVNEDE